MFREAIEYLPVDKVECEAQVREQISDGSCAVLLGASRESDCSSRFGCGVTAFVGTW